MKTIKIYNALQTKNIIFEKAGLVSEAKGKLIIVTGLSSGEGEAAKILKAGNHAVPGIPLVCNPEASVLQTRVTMEGYKFSIILGLRLQSNTFIIKTSFSKCF